MENKICCAFGTDCNNNCIYCSNTVEDRGPAITLEEIPSVLERIRKTKNAEVEISGGEPTMRPELFYFLEQLYADNPKINCTLLTNGRNFSKVDLTAKLAESNISRIMVPVHADSRELHDYITQSPGSFDETMLGIRNLYEYNLPVNLKIVVNKLNYARMPQIVEMLAQRFPACSGLITYGLELNGKAIERKDEIGVRLTETVQYLEKAVEIGKKYGFKIWIYSVPPCVLGADYRKYAGNRAHPTTIRKTQKWKMKPVEVDHRQAEKCGGCRYVSGCMGVWNGYFDNYGTDEVHQILRT